MNLFKTIVVKFYDIHSCGVLGWPIGHTNEYRKI